MDGWNNVADDCVCVAVMKQVLFLEQKRGYKGNRVRRGDMKEQGGRVDMKALD